MALHTPEQAVGRFRSGRPATRPTTAYPTPEPLSTWRVTTGDPRVAARVAGLLGGRPAAWESAGAETLEVLTDTAEARVLLDGSAAVTARMVLWGAGGVRVRECDGTTVLDGDRRGDPCDRRGGPCDCRAPVEREAAATTSLRPRPEVAVRFRLADDPELGVFHFQSSSWELAWELRAVTEALVAVGGPARASLSLDPVEVASAKGRLGVYRRPVIRVLGPA